MHEIQNSRSEDQDTLEATVDRLRQEMDHLLKDNSRLTAQNSAHLQLIERLRKESSPDTNPDQKTVDSLNQTIQELEERVMALVQEKLKLRSTVDALKHQLGQPDLGASQSRAGWLGGLLTKTTDDALLESIDDAITSEKELEVEAPRRDTGDATAAIASPAAPASQADILAAALSKKNTSGFGKRLSGIFGGTKSNTAGASSSSHASPSKTSKQDEETKAFRREFREFRRQQKGTTENAEGNWNVAAEDPLAPPLEPVRASSGGDDRKSWEAMKDASTISDLFDHQNSQTSKGGADQSKFIEAALQNKSERKRNNLLF